MPPKFVAPLVGVPPSARKRKREGSQHNDSKGANKVIKQFKQWATPIVNAAPVQRKNKNKIEWTEERKAVILSLREDGKTSEEIKEIMRTQHEFEASISMYKDKFKEWGAQKNFNRKQRCFILRQAKQAARIPNFKYIDSGKQVDKEKVQRLLESFSRYKGDILEDEGLSPGGLRISYPASPYDSIPAQAESQVQRMDIEASTDGLESATEEVGSNIGSSLVLRSNAGTIRCHDEKHTKFEEFCAGCVIEHVISSLTTSSGQQKARTPRRFTDEEAGALCLRVLEMLSIPLASSDNTLNHSSSFPKRIVKLEDDSENPVPLEVTPTTPPLLSGVLVPLSPKAIEEFMSSPTVAHFLGNLSLIPEPLINTTCNVDDPTTTEDNDAEPDIEAECQDLLSRLLSNYSTEAIEFHPPPRNLEHGLTEAEKEDLSEAEVALADLEEAVAMDLSPDLKRAIDKADRVLLTLEKYLGRGAEYTLAAQKMAWDAIADITRQLIKERIEIDVASEVLDLALENLRKRFNWLWRNLGIDHPNTRQCLNVLAIFTYISSQKSGNIAVHGDVQRLLHLSLNGRATDLALVDESYDFIHLETLRTIDLLYPTWIVNRTVQDTPEFLENWAIDIGVFNEYLRLKRSMSRLSDTDLVRIVGGKYQSQGFSASQLVKWFIEVCRYRQQRYGKGSDKVLAAGALLAQALEDYGQDDKAAEIRVKVYKSYNRQGGDRSTWTRMKLYFYAENLREIAFHLVKVKDFDGALRVLEEVLSHQTQLLNREERAVVGDYYLDATILLLVRVMDKRGLKMYIQPLTSRLAKRSELRDIADHSKIASKHSTETNSS